MGKQPAQSYSQSPNQETDESRSQTYSQSPYLGNLIAGKQRISTSGSQSTMTQNPKPSPPGLHSSHYAPLKQTQVLDEGNLYLDARQADEELFRSLRSTSKTTRCLFEDDTTPLATLFLHDTEFAAYSGARRSKSGCTGSRTCREGRLDGIPSETW